MKRIQKRTIPMQKSTTAAFCISVIILLLTYTISQWLIIQGEEKNFMEELEVQTKESLSFAKFLFDAYITTFAETREKQIIVISGMILPQYRWRGSHLKS